MITKVADVATLVAAGKADPKPVFGEIRAFAASGDWKVREVAATVLVELSKKHPDAVIAELRTWSRASDENVRRASSEGLRGLARTRFESVVPILETLNADASPYVRKSVANLLRDGGKKNPMLVLDTCERWLRISGGDANTRWIVTHGLAKIRETEPQKVAALLVPLPEKKPAAKRAPARKQ
ncbi:HEAT repeat domain-containing protein [Dokdonella sp.]|uniref:HEAT repeat domain-containing protein n=1 Tax=Dokdonella sp. TaxID=2291710 RepID=UPI001B2CA773|nr:HEAT repeat domain-containing protein [Dokdonella sp.]MBO9664664.1 DNA alkylation repair protein [Dokdonella sp.]